MKSPLLGKFRGPKPNARPRGANQRFDVPMHHYAPGEEVDFCIIGAGAGGGVLAQRLAHAGLSVVVIEAGPFWDVERDWVSDEAGSHKLYWNRPIRISGGSDPLAFGANNSGQGVGGSTVHWASFTPRLHPSDFRVYSEDSVGVDWPISYDDLKPYYELMEAELPVSGPAWYPWGDAHGYLYGPHPPAGVADVLARGCDKLGIRVSRGGPVAIVAGAFGERPHCIYRGFCIQGCKVGAKQSTLISHIPDAIRHRAEIRANCMATYINLGSDGCVTSVTYYDADGNEHEQKARVIAVCGYSIETPRLLLHSTSSSFPNGLANSSGTVGRYLMAQSGNVVIGRFHDLIRMYKGPPANSCTEDFYETDHQRDFVRGFSIQTVGPLPITFAKEMAVAKGAWGWGLREVMMDYNHWAAIGVLGEILPHADNRVELVEENDEHGVPLAKVTFGLHENDRRIVAFGVRKCEEILYAAGAEEVVQEPRYAHLVGACRMGRDPRDSVTDGWGRTHDVPNLFICDGSLLPTQGSANPGLTIQALAARTADYIIAERESVLRRAPKYVPAAAVPIHYDLSPTGTTGHGVPRVKSTRPRVQIGLGGVARDTKDE
ncbi:MAG TPA: GMC family oxidoreductase [Ktedonobacterales bacterium]